MRICERGRQQPEASDSWAASMRRCSALIPATGSGSGAAVGRRATKDGACRWKRSKRRFRRSGAVCGDYPQRLKAPDLDVVIELNRAGAFGSVIGPSVC